MIQIYADNTIAYDSRLEEYTIIGLSVEMGLNKGGAATFTMPPGHPAYQAFLPYKTVVRVLRDGDLLFRGRVLYPKDDFYGRRTITCEGELCFLQDAVVRAFKYESSPAAIFTDVIGIYNNQVEAAKRFTVGTITVTTPASILLEDDQAEQVSEVVTSLLDRCGGYIIFTTGGGGDRVINWYSSISGVSSQTIEFGENLLDFSRSESNSSLATAVLPYGAANDDGVRVDITSVNGGVDYIQDNAAVALRGFMMVPVYWDDIETPAALLTAAQQYLASSKLLLTSLELTAIDLSAIDTTIDQFRLGDNIHVISVPHAVSDWFELTEMSLDLLNPHNNRITLGKTTGSLTGTTVSSERGVRTAAVAAARAVVSGHDIDVTEIIRQTAVELTSLIQQTSEAILLQVSESYTTGADVTGMITSQITQLSDSIAFQFQQLQAIIDEDDEEIQDQFKTIEKYIRFENGDIILGETGNELTLRIENDRISFLSSGAEVAYISDRRLYITDGEYLQSLKIGQYAFVPRDNGNLSFKVV